MKISRYLALVLLILQPLFVSAEETATCDEFTVPFLSTADFNGDGIVNGKDIAMLSKFMGNNGKKNRNNSAYSALFDRVGDDGVIDILDLHSATRRMGELSTTEDQDLVTAYNDFLAGNYVCAETVKLPIDPIDPPPPVNYNY